MKVYDCLQGSDEWKDLHLGIPTASQFHRILTPAKEQLAEGRWAYAYELAVERLLKETKHTAEGLYWPERGKLLEHDAVRHYEFVHSCRTAKVGFITPDHGKWGCSPDRLIVEEVGGLELKCPSPEKHLEYFDEEHKGPGFAYRCQIQGSMLITGFPWWDFMSYHPQLPDALYRYQRDQPFIDKLEEALKMLCDEVDIIVEKVKEAGFVPAPGQIPRQDDGWDAMMRADSGMWAIG